MNSIILYNAIFIVLLIAIAIPLGIYIYRVVTGNGPVWPRVFASVKRGIYRRMGVKTNKSMSPR